MPCAIEGLLFRYSATETARGIWAKVKCGEWYIYQLGEALQTTALNGEKLAASMRLMRCYDGNMTTTTAAFEIIADSDESERRFDLLHDNVKKYGTVFNTIAPDTQLTDKLYRKSLT